MRWEMKGKSSFGASSATVSLCAEVDQLRRDARPPDVQVLGDEWCSFKRSFH